MFDPAAVDLDELCVALDDRDHARSWWIHPGSGEIKPHIPELDGDESPEEHGWTHIDPVTSDRYYRDMADFVAAVPDRRVAERLDRAITGKGAFRRFKDTLFELPDLRDTWYRFAEARAARRALDWLRDAGLVDPEAAERVLAEHPDPPVLPDPLAAAVAADLRVLYGTRLREVVLFGSRARGDHTQESDLDLLVVLDDPVDAWQEMDAMDEVLWRHSQASGVVVTALVTGSARWLAPDAPVLLSAAAEGLRVA